MGSNASDRRESGPAPATFRADWWDLEDDGDDEDEGEPKGHWWDRLDEVPPPEPAPRPTRSGLPSLLDAPRGGWDSRDQRRSARHREVRPATIEVARITKRERASMRRRYPEAERRRLPLTRGDCIDGPRPCPYVSCRHHLYADETYGGNIKVSFPDLEPHELEPSCVLDVVDELGPVTLEDAGRLLNVTRERVRQLSDKAIGKLGVRGLREWADFSEPDDGDEAKLPGRMT